MLNNYVPLLVMFVLAAGFVVVSVGAAAFIGPKRYNRAKLDAYECGIEPTPQPMGGGRFPVKFYLTAIAYGLILISALATTRLCRGNLWLAPLFPFYLAVGWSNPTGIFGIVGVFKSLVEGENLQKGQMDYRDIENLDVVYTWEQNPLMGTGWGHPFLEKIKLPDISHAFADYLYHPHNSVLGMLAYGGIIGFSGLWAWVSVTMFLAVRAYHRAHEPEARAGGLVAMSVIVAYTNQCFGDMGTISWLGTVLAAMAATCAGKLATVTNAWPTPHRLRNEVSAPEKSASPAGNLV